MSTIRTIACVLGVVLLVALPALGQTTYTFVQATGDWDSEGNWTPEGGPPGSEDTAIIPDGKNCLVAASDQSAAVINVQSGGTLAIAADKTLTISEDSQIDGELTFTRPGCVSCEAQHPGILHLAASLKIVGDGGIIRGAPCNCTTEANSGRITGETGVLLELDDGETGTLTLKNRLHIQVDIENSAHILVDDSSSLMVLGELVSGDGDFDVEEGTLEIDGYIDNDAGSHWKACGNDATIAILSPSYICSDGTWELGGCFFEVYTTFTHRGPSARLAGACVGGGTAGQQLYISVPAGEIVSFGPNTGCQD